MTYLTEFPDYDPATMPPIPEGFEDVSWGNDTCPSFHNRYLRLTIWTDFADPMVREFPESPRFTFVPTDEEGDGAMECLAHEDWTASYMVALIGAEFAALLRHGLTEAQMERVRAENATPDYQGDTCCASHNVCDANEPMAAAFAVVTGHEVDCSRADDVNLMNAAWSFAKRGWLTAPRP